MSRIETVHVVFKTHLDIGFTDLAGRVVQRYREEFIPKAIELAQQLDAKGGEAQFVWTTGSWLIHHYLKHGTESQRRTMSEAIEKGYIAWHGLPFTTQTELLDSSLFQYGISLRDQLDQTFGKKTIAAKMTDVPGHTIGMVPLLEQAGIQYLHLGMNPASKRPSVPKVYRWQTAEGSEVIVNYAENYGEHLHVDGMQDVLVFAHTGDNCGPPSVQDIQHQFAELAKQYPGAHIKASTMDAFAAKLLAVREQLPIVREELGDTWIHGVGTDPLKMGMYRELLRLRSKWLSEGRLKKDSHEFEELSESLLLVAEHTWGLDIKKFLPDFKHYAKNDFYAAREKDLIDLDDVPDKYSYISSFAMNEFDHLSQGLFAAESRERRYSLVEASWQEQRDYMKQGIEALSVDKKQEALQALESLKPMKSEHVDAEQWQADQLYQLQRFEVAFGSDGSLVHLKDRCGKVWADEQHLLGAYRYEAFGTENYAHWFDTYMENLPATHPWADADFGKPGFEFAQPRPTHRLYTPSLIGLKHTSLATGDLVIAKLRLPREAEERYGAPKEIELLYTFDHDSDTIDVELNWRIKDACRLPEASWLSFSLRVDNPNLWMMEKLGMKVSPLHVAKDGNRNLHAVESGLSYTGTDSSADIYTLDAPLVSPGRRRLLQFDNTFAPLSEGMHFNLHNNVWGTNYPMWFGEDAKFRFRLKLQTKKI